MNIKEITIRVQTSKQYQVFETTITASDVENNEDMQMLRNTAIKESISGLNKLCDDMGIETNEQPKVNTTITKTPSYMTNTSQNTNTDTKVVDGFQYKKCFNKSNGEVFYALVNPDDINRGARKYVK